MKGLWSSCGPAPDCRRVGLRSWESTVTTTDRKPADFNRTRVIHRPAERSGCPCGLTDDDTSPELAHD